LKVTICLIFHTDVCYVTCNISIVFKNSRNHCLRLQRCVEVIGDVELNILPTLFQLRELKLSFVRTILEIRVI
jgi:hypothetical protein